MAYNAEVEEVRSMFLALDHYRAKRDDLATFSAPLHSGVSARAWWQARATTHPGVSRLVWLAQLLLDIVPHAADPERVFSTMGFLSKGYRNSMDPDMTKMLTTIRMHELRRQAPGNEALARDKRPAQPLEGNLAHIHTHEESMRLAAATAALARMAGTLGTLGTLAEPPCDEEDVTEEDVARGLDELHAADKDDLQAGLTEVAGLNFSDLLAEAVGSFDLTNPVLLPTFNAPPAAPAAAPAPVQAAARSAAEIAVAVEDLMAE